MPFWGFRNGTNKKRKEEKNKRRKLPKIVVTLVAPLAHATRSDQNTKNSGVPKLLRCHTQLARTNGQIN